MGSVSDQSYDYIICGGGTAGCVVAARIAEDPNVSILLLEAGVTKDKVPLSAIPAAVAQVVGTDADWRFFSEPCKEMNDRQISLHRGKFVGGSSGCNGTLCIRGAKQDYDDWQVKGWSGAEMHRYMSKAESFRNKSWFEATSQAHGTNGPLVTAPHDNAPISDLMMESFKSKGLPYHPDMFTTGDVAHGCGHAVRSIYQGIRSTAADFIYSQAEKSNITIETNSHVESVVLSSSDGKYKATGVNLLVTDESRNSKRQVNARKEVILCSGAYCSPTILMRSGIGATEELERHGIKSLVDLPGVGKNLHDHLITLLFYEVDQPGLTTDHHVWHTGGAEKSMTQYQLDKTGFMSQFPFGSFAYARLDERLADSPLWREAQTRDGRDPMGLTPNQPHVEFWNTECFGPKVENIQSPGDGKHAFAMVTELFSPRSVGSVSLASTDVLKHPVVDHNYLSDPLDMLVLSEACALANEIVVGGSGTKDIVSGSWPAELTHHALTKREEWIPIIRDNVSTCYHPAGTCKMGSAEDSSAVVDAQLRVHGVDGLRVVDASIIPKLMGGHPQMAVYGIAEKAADMIKAGA